MQTGEKFQIRGAGLKGGKHEIQTIGYVAE